MRGGLVDVFPTTGREPIRIELYGDEIEQVRAFSPFTQRALHPVDGAVVYPAAERKADLTEPTLADDEEGQASFEVPDDLVPVLGRPPDFVWQPDEVRRVWSEEGLGEISLKGTSELDPFPQAQPFSFEAQRPAIAARGLAEAENELNGFVNGGNRVVVAFPHAGEALRTDNLLKRADARVLDPGQDLPGEPELLFAVAPARRGFVWRELGLVLLPDTQVFRKRPPRADKRLGRALASFADLRTGDFIVHEDHGVGKLLGFETKEVAGVTRDYLFLAFRGEDRLYVPHEQLGKISKYIGADAGAPTLSKLGGKAWQNLKARARESVQELATELIALYAQRQQAPGTAYDLESEWLERLETEFPYRETEDQARAIEAVKEDLEAPRPMDRLVCGDVGFGKTEVAVRAAFAAAMNGKQTLVLCPTTILAEQHWNTFKARYRDFPVRVEMVSRFRKPAETKQILKDFAEGKIEVLVGTHRVSQPRRDPEGPRPRHPRRGAALRRRPEGAAAQSPARGRRARALGDADPAHAAHVALGPARHLDHRDASRGPAADPHDGGGVRRGAREDGARARDRAQRPGVLPAQPGRDDRGGGGEAAAALPEAALHRRARADAGARARGEDARVPRVATPTCSSRRRSSSRGSTSRRRTR